MPVDDLIFVGFNARVLGIDRYTGEIAWKWQASTPWSGYVTLLLDGDRLIVSVNGYLYCLDPSNGEQLWYNETKGCGTGVASIASVRGQTGTEVAAQAAAQAAQQQSATVS